MRDRVLGKFRQGASAFGTFTAGQKAITIVAILGLAIGGYFFATWASAPTYAPLYSNLSGTDASAIVDKLAADGTPYQITDGGGTIMVPRDQVYAERIKMSGAGLPAQSEAGYALLDKQDTMTSEFMQQVGYRRALEGELAKSIKSIDGVNSATVHLAIPKKDVFTDNQEKTTASVLVAMSPTKKLSGEQAQAIVHLVSSSVEGLDPEQVTVVGSNGAVLSAVGQASAAGSDVRSRETQDFESRMNTSLQRMLDQALGPNHAVVQVTADLDFDSTETKTQRYVADPNTPPLSESRKEESYTGNGTTTGGVLGPDNIQVPGGAGGGAGEYNQTNETKNNAVGMVTETRKAAPGAVRKLAVAVLLDDAVVAGGDVGRLQELLTSAAGLDTARGDTIAVTPMKFDGTTAKQIEKDLAEAKKAEADERLKSWIETGAVVAGVLLLLLFALISGLRRNKKKKLRLTAEERRKLAEMQAAVEEAERRAALEQVTKEQAAAAALAAPTAAETKFAEIESRKREVVSLIERQPDEVAQLLRGWLADRRG